MVAGTVRQRNRETKEEEKRIGIGERLSSA
jgi:hypothetical protein